MTRNRKMFQLRKHKDNKEKDANLYMILSNCFALRFRYSCSVEKYVNFCDSIRMYEPNIYTKLKKTVTGGLFLENSRVLRTWNLVFRRTSSDQLDMFLRLLQSMFQDFLLIFFQTIFQHASRNVPIELC